MPIRSGRFRWDTPHTSPLPIIGVGAGKESAFYRILNSGDHDFVVRWGTPGRSLTLAPTQSIDIAAKGTEVSISAAADHRVEGIYDFLSLQHPVRSGRFRVATTTAGGLAPPHTIIDAGNSAEAAFYRIYNSGQAPIKVMPNVGSSPIIERLYPDLSFDFKVEKNRVITVEEIQLPPPAGGGTPPPPVGQIEGIYEYLGE